MMNYQEKIIMGAVIGTAIAGGVQISQAQAAVTQTGYTKSQLNLRSTASTSSRVLLTMPKGAKVTILSKDNYGWYKVQYGSKIGYCSGLYITTSTSTTTNTTNNTTTVGYTTEKLNLRASSSTSGKVLATMPKGAKLTIIGTASNGWYKVKYNTTTGFCSGQYVSESKTTTTSTTNKITSVNYIVINRAKHTLTCYNGNTVVKTLPCCVGKASTPTPSGNFKIISRESNRPYYKRGIPGGDPTNPLGTRFLQLTTSGYAIHGTNNPNSIGHSYSHGCIRLHNYDVEWLYTMVRVGCNVTIK